jgi:hypothetical protein
MTNRSANAPKFQNEVAVAKLSQDRLSDTELDRVAGGMSTGTAWTGVPVPRR